MLKAEMSEPSGTVFKLGLKLRKRKLSKWQRQANAPCGTAGKETSIIHRIGLEQGQPGQ
jgi:hypothetical protein